jgi:hypothetical protein
MRAALVLLAGLACVACEKKVDPGPAVQATKPATGAQLASYASNSRDQVELARDAPLVQLFCQQATGKPCPADIETRLAAYGFKDKLTAVDLANAFTMMLADSIDGSPDLNSSDEDFLAAAYRVVLNRSPDVIGAQSNLKFIKETGQREQLLKSMLESEEFKAR